MMQNHRKDNWDMTKANLTPQEEILKGIMKAAQAQQMKDLETRGQADIKEMQAEQVKTSVETAKEVQNDPKLKLYIYWGRRTII